MELHEEIQIIVEAGRSGVSAALPWKSFFPVLVIYFVPIRDGWLRCRLCDSFYGMCTFSGT